MLTELWSCFRDSIIWKARKNERDQDMRVDNPRLLDSKMFQGLRRREFYSTIRVTESKSIEIVLQAPEKPKFINK